MCRWRAPSCCQVRGCGNAACLASSDRATIHRPATASHPLAQPDCTPHPAGDIFTLWRVQRWSDVTLESLSLLRLLRPVPGARSLHACGWMVPHWSAPAPLPSCKPAPAPRADLLVLGTGRTPRQLPPELARQLHDMGVRVDATSTVRGLVCTPCGCPCLRCAVLGARCLGRSVCLQVSYVWCVRVCRSMRWRRSTCSIRRAGPWWARCCLKMPRTEGQPCGRSARPGYSLAGARSVCKRKQGKQGQVEQAGGR